jgi:HTH-type transcriptional regulator/antitoxin HigA
MKTLNKQAYANLLAEFLPQAIETEEENERYLAEVEKLMALGEDINPEQEQLLKLLVILIEQFEDEHYHLKTATPHEVLNELMLARGLRQKDLVEIFGSKGITSEVVNGRRSISKAMALRLGEFFHVTPALFLEVQ